LPSWFGFGAYQAKLIFKMPLPQIDIDLAIVKKITPFFIVQITQQAVMIISLKFA
jgi:hypothetical protein